MLDNIINGVKGQLSGELQQKFNINPDQANRSVDMAKDNLSHGLKKEATGGDFGGIMDLLKGKKAPAESSAVNGMTNKYISDLTSKLGIPSQVANQIGPFVMTFLMNKVTGKVQSDGMGQTDIMGMLGGGLADKLPKGIADKLGGFFK
ncbi:DUF937 domain-containing protein [Pontibacter sp. SGAir0037]|uniref:DUF937 domain-containing protein n=1 Tax=Pontibacter sp. SGAir0037 TaxID=2571030 RepID=UPI0010CCD08B|nr:DUF937 domain-containing protein [Pontibacter sp. SGAir0037]QCR23528.1 hypothetical protein C1N53_15040 [Pontibacter sp. SGAir0037]